MTGCSDMTPEIAALIAAGERLAAALSGHGGSELSMLEEEMAADAAFRTALAAAKAACDAPPAAALDNLPGGVS